MGASQEQYFQKALRLPAQGLSLIRLRTHQEQLEELIASAV